MTSQLDNLCGPGKPLLQEPPDESEFMGLKRSALARLKDARNPANSLESRFDLAYNAAHALCLAAPTGLSASQSVYRVSGFAAHPRLGAGSMACACQMPRYPKPWRVRGRLECG